MSGKTNIEWATDQWNPVAGCSVVSAGCKRCYAMKLAGTRLKHTPQYRGLTVDTKEGPVWNGELRAFDGQVLTLPLHWKKPRRIFVNSMSDLFHEALPDEAVDRIFAVMALCPQHQLLVLTKRAKRMRDYLLARNGMGNELLCREINDIPAHLGNRRGALEMPLPNVWLGVSAEDQDNFDERWQWLADTPAAVRFVSYEPALGPLDLSGALEGETRPDWIIIGGESGIGAREFNIDWARTVIEQCRAAGIAVFVKQLGREPFEESENAHGPFEKGLKDGKGGDMSEWPADLRIREFPRQSS